ncbi:uncharacterized protein At1g76660-like [Wolffia australiana]
MAVNGPPEGGNGSGRGGAGAGASISAATAAMGSAESRFPLPELPQQRRRRWGGGCLGGLSCFGLQGRAKRVVPSSSSRTDGLTNGLRLRGNLVAATTPLPSAIQRGAGTMPTPSLLAPPSSPASFTQSPSCLLSPASPVDGASAINLSPAATMFATGPYAHETQLVSPPVFSTFTTEPSTAPLTPPPELAHLTTPSSPEVPYARFLSGSTLLPPALPTTKNFMTSPDCRGGIFCAAASAQFYLDQALQHPPPSSSSVKRDDEIEAYRASFGFSADEVVISQNYMDGSDGDEPFSIAPPLPPSSAPADNLPMMIMTKGKEEIEFVGEGRGRISRSFRLGKCVSDAEVDYRRSSSAREPLVGGPTFR